MTKPLNLVKLITREKKEKRGTIGERKRETEKKNNHRDIYGNLRGIRIFFFFYTFPFHSRLF